MKTKAFLDTTILVDCLLKPHSIKSRVAKESSEQFQERLVPQYAIKEFKDGALRYFVWFHNNLVATGSHARTIADLQALSRTPQRYLTSTALEALARFAFELAPTTLADLTRKYGPETNLDRINTDSYRLHAKVAIAIAWQNRRALATESVFPLACYDETDPRERRGMIDLIPSKCLRQDCALRETLISDLDQLRAVESANSALPKNDERAKRSNALKEIIRKPKQPIPPKECRKLGDAIFAILCPKDCVLLTTNTKDHEPLAAALDKEVVSPSGLIP